MDEADDWRAQRRIKNSFQTDYGDEVADDEETHGKHMLDGLRREATRGNPSDLGWGIGGLVLLVGCLGAGLIQMGVDGTIAFFIIVVAAIFIGNYATAKNRKGYGAVPEELIREWLWTRRRIRQLAEAGSYRQLVHEGHLQRMEAIKFEIYQKMREG